MNYWIKSIALDAAVAVTFCAAMVTGSAIVLAPVLLLCWAVTIGRMWAAYHGDYGSADERPAGFMLYHIACESILIFALIGCGHAVTALAYAIGFAAFELGADGQEEERVSA